MRIQFSNLKKPQQYFHLQNGDCFLICKLTDNQHRKASDPAFLMQLHCDKHWLQREIPRQDTASTNPLRPYK